MQSVLRDALIAHGSSGVVRKATTNKNAENVIVEYEETLSDGTILIAIWTAIPLEDPTPNTSFYLNPGFYTRIVRREGKQQFHISQTTRGAKTKFFELQAEYPDGIVLDASKADSPCCWDVTTGECCTVL
jgi:hypothetical protein